MARKRKREETQEEEGLREAAAEPEEVARTEGEARPPLTPVDVQQKAFRVSFRGYNEGEVDEFLDQITETLARLHEENKRLAEQIAGRGAIPEATGDARRRAEELVRQAREHAARIITQAERRAGTPEAAQGSGMSKGFLVRERRFLKQLATLVQGHAAELKREAQLARRTSQEQPDSGREPPPAEEAEPAAASASSEEQQEPSDASDEAGDVPPPEPAGASEAGSDPATEWENPFLAEESGGERRGSREPHLETGGSEPREHNERDSGEEEPSLRELFWGEE